MSPRRQASKQDRQVGSTTAAGRPGDPAGLRPYVLGGDMCTMPALSCSPAQHCSEELKSVGAGSVNPGSNFGVHRVRVLPGAMSAAGGHPQRGYTMSQYCKMAV